MTIGLREFLLLIFGSAVLMLVAGFCFRRQPATRRLFILIGCVIFVSVPMVSTTFGLTLSIGVREVPSLAGYSNFPSGLTAILTLVSSVLVLAYVAVVVRERLSIRNLPMIRDPRVQDIADALVFRCSRLNRVILRAGRAPCCTSLGVCTIVLPQSWPEWDESTLEAVIAHEAIHLARTDDRWTVAIEMMVRWFWYLPWLLKLPHLFDRAVEESCDDAASQLIRSESGYLSGVLKVVTGIVETRNVAARQLGGSSLAGRCRRFNDTRDQQIDTRGLYWASVWFALIFLAICTAKITQIQPDPHSQLRIVAKTLRTDAADRIDLTLAQKPVKLQVLGIVMDPPRR